MHTIAFTGTNGTGKTTLVNELSKHFPDTPVLTNTTRKVPKELRGTDKGQRMILANFTEAFMTAQKFSGGFLSDRTLFDNCAYSKVSGVWTDKEIDAILSAYIHTSIFPEYLFYTPIEFPMVQDGERNMAEKREEVDEVIKGFLDKYCPTDYITITGTVEERVARILKEITK